MKKMLVFAVLFLQLSGCAIKSAAERGETISLTSAEAAVAEAFALSGIEKIKLHVDLEVCMK